ncbi:MAG: hypothetical protein HY927_14420 [Elusimicrobia bacterium]|nr:hypothetical protein [Elusimicrobiota bacterium]
MSVAKLPLKEMVKTSDLIVVAQVRSVTIAKASPPLNPLEISREEENHASARVLEVWKGNPPETVIFLASPTWTCDISDAVLGEKAVLFLKSRGPQLFQIELAGRGRMPLRIVDGVCYATIWHNVIIPSNVPMIDGPDPHFKFIRSIKLNYLKRMVLGKQESPAPQQHD